MGFSKGIKGEQDFSGQKRANWLRFVILFKLDLLKLNWGGKLKLKNTVHVLIASEDFVHLFMAFENSLSCISDF